MENDEVYKTTALHDVARECPFCGGRNVILVETQAKGRATRYGVMCASCPASMESPLFRHPWEAIDAWNGGEQGRYCDRRDAD
ncbi:Lar family restriction alleviation protein [Atopobiaceae bacterium HCP3S3_F7]